MKDKKCGCCGRRNTDWKVIIIVPKNPIVKLLTLGLRMRVVLCQYCISRLFRGLNAKR